MSAILIPTIGIVGGIGSGKSTVAAELRSHGGYVIDADRLGHDALEQPEIKKAIVERWGPRILDAHGNTDRRKVARIVFDDRTELRALESIVLPLIENRIMQDCATARSQADVKFVILDAAILMETGWDRHCDKIIFVDVPREVRIARLADKRGWNEKELERREAAQLPLDQKKGRAAAVIVNDADTDKVARQVRELLLQWQII